MATPARDEKGRFVSVAWKGSPEMIRKLKNLAQAMPQEVARALYQETEIEAKECKRRCPVDTGELRASIHQEGPEITGGLFTKGSISTMIVCGGPAAPYAIYVHEDLTAYHKVGQAKFIESTLLESQSYMADRIAHRIDLNRAAEK